LQSGNEDDETGYEEMLGIFNQVQKNFEEAFSGFYSSLFDISERSLKPLYRIEVNESRVLVIFDFPFVEKKEDLSIEATEKTLTVSAKMKRPISMLVGGPYQRNFEFDKYSQKIILPVTVDPTKAKAKFRGGLLRVEFPFQSTSKTIMIE
jgi:HSP20 family protein